MAVSRSAQAVMWLAADASRTQADAAERFNVNKSTISRAWSKREATGSCPCCGQTMKMGDKPGGPKKDD